MEDFGRMTNLVFHRVKDFLCDYDSIDVFRAVNTSVNIIHDEEIQAFLIKTHDGESDYCNQCGYCCQAYNINLRVLDVEELSKVTSIHDNLVDNGEFYRFKHKPCKYLLSDGRCRYYNHRPLSCRNHPLTNHDQPRIIRDPECNFCIQFFIDKSISLLTKKPFK